MPIGRNGGGGETIFIRRAHCAQQTETKFNAALDESIQSIFEASNT
jgi:hypothetical protein